MNNKSYTMRANTSFVLKMVSWLFGTVVFVIGAINTIWGNDPGFGVFLILLAFAYFPPTNVILKRKTGFSIPRYVKVALAIFIVWAALGVGELFDKIDLMIMDL
jgi:hypothetical protein